MKAPSVGLSLFLMRETIPRSGLVELFWWLARRRRLCRVTGGSMEPLLHSGDLVLLNAGAYAVQSPQVDDVVVVRHPFVTGQWDVKRITAVSPNGRLTVRGDNRLASSDSAAWGTLSPDRVIGQVTSHLW